MSKSPGTTPKHTPTTSSDAPAGSNDGKDPVKDPSHLSLPDKDARSPFRAISPAKDRASANRVGTPFEAWKLSKSAAVYDDHEQPNESFDETITRAFGSVLDPIAKRQKWSCAACNSMFVRVSLTGVQNSADD